MLSWRSRGLWLVLIIFGMASRAFTCPVCGVGRDGTTSVYLLTAVLMCTVLLTIFGGMVYYMCQQTRLDDEEQSQPASE